MTLKTKEEIADLLKSITENEKILRGEMPPVPFSEVVTYQRLKMQASDNVQDAVNRYSEYVKSHIGGIILNGPLESQREFAKQAETIGQTHTFDSADFYRRLTDVGFGMMGGTGNLTADQLALCFTEIRLAKQDLNIFRLRDPDFQWMFAYSWSDPQKFSDAMRHSLFLTNGLRFTESAMFRRIWEEALRLRSPRTTIPVVIIGAREEELPEFDKLLTHGYITLDLTDKTVDEKLVTDTFIQLRETIKAKAPTTKENNNDNQ